MFDSIILWKKVIRRTPPLLPLNYSSASFDLLKTIIEDKSTHPIVLDEIAKSFYNSNKVIELIVRDSRLLPETVRFLLANSTDNIRQLIISVREKALTTSQTDKNLAVLEAEGETEEAVYDEINEKNFSLFQQIQKMAVPEKVQLALKGNKEARGILIRDSNKKVSLTVLESPKMTEQEVEMIAQSKNVAEDVLREIARKKEWLKNYTIVISLVSNPKTPVGISLSHLSHIKEKDLKDLSKNKNISETIRSAANRLIILRKSKQSGDK